MAEPINLHPTWEEVVICERWRLQLPRHRAQRWRDIPLWEAPRFGAMAANLRAGDVLFDIGAEQGDHSAVYAQMGGGKVRMCLFESHPGVWRNIRQTWERNKLPPPLACWPGLLGRESTEPSAGIDYAAESAEGWPRCAWDPGIWEHTSYRYVHQHLHSTPQMTVDDWVASTGIVPDAITMDIEGAEVLVLQGARETLAAHRPLVFVSVHAVPGGDGRTLLERDYNSDRESFLQLTRSLGLVGRHVHTDHEEHWVFWTAGGREPVL